MKDVFDPDGNSVKGTAIATLPRLLVQFSRSLSRTFGVDRHPRLDSIIDALDPLKEVLEKGGWQ
jgi:hypothetical protein